MFRFMFLAVIWVVISCSCHRVDDTLVDLQGNDDISKAINEGHVANIRYKNAAKIISDTEPINRRRHNRAATIAQTQRTPAPPTAVESTISNDQRFLRHANEEPKKVVCYFDNEASERSDYGEFTAEDIDSTTHFCTHVIILSATIDVTANLLNFPNVTTNLLNFPNKKNLQSLVRRKRVNSSLKIMLSIGGPQERVARFSDSQVTKAPKFAEHLVKFLSDNGLDGIDIYWPYSNKQYFDMNFWKLAFATFRAEFDKHAAQATQSPYLLSIALPILKERVEEQYDLAVRLSAYVDFINVLAFNYHDSWEPRVNHHAPLYYQQQKNEYQYDNKLNVNYTISYLIEKGADARKLVLGIPTFGRTFRLTDPKDTLLGAPADGPGTGGEVTRRLGYLAYYEICRKIKHGGWTIVNDKKNAMGPHAFNDHEWVSYDSVNSAKLKATFANEKGLGGITFYTIDMDDFKGSEFNETYSPIMGAAMIEFLFGLSGPIPQYSTTQSTRAPEMYEWDSHVVAFSPADERPKKMICYLTNAASKREGIGRFTAENVDPFLCTHVIVSSAILHASNNSISFPDEDNLLESLPTVKRKQRYHENSKLMLSIGGPRESSAHFSDILNDRVRRAEFITNVVQFLTNTLLDGIDIDWRYSVERTPADRENYKLALQEFREALDKITKRYPRSRFVLSITLPILEEHIDKGYDLSAISSYVDFMSVLAYNYHDSNEPFVNHHAPVYYQQGENEYQYDKKLTINHTISYLIEKGADKKKLVLGVPTFGRTYTLTNPNNTSPGAPAKGPGEQGKLTHQPGFLTFYEICKNIKNGGWIIGNNKKNSTGPYAYSGSEWVSYDGMSSARLKGEYAKKRGLGGLMFYAIDMDDFTGTCHDEIRFPIINTAKQAFLVGVKHSHSVDAAKEFLVGDEYFPRFAAAIEENSPCSTPRGEKGVCIRIKQCPTLYTSLRSSNIENIHYIQRSQCGTGTGASRVCCPNSTLSAVPPRPKAPGILSFGVERGNPDICGKPSTTDVFFEDNNVGTSRLSALGNWPWMASIRYEYFDIKAANSYRVSHRCGGVLISKRYVLTVASCLHNKRFPIHSVRLGDLQLDSNYDGASPIDVQVDRVITHPQFVLTPRLMNNIALIRLNTSVEYTPTIRPVCLQNGPEYLTDDYYLKRNPFVVDWDQNDLTQVEIKAKMINTSVCEQDYEKFPATIDQRVLCAGVRTISCANDLFGPLLFVELNDKAEVTYYLGGLGVISFGQQCTLSNFPGVYSRVAAYIDWISETTGLKF